MRMSNTCEKLDTCNISPIRSKTKFTSTPVRTKRKTSRRSQGVDVHTTLNSNAHSPRFLSPNQNSPHLSNTSINSPSSSFPYSQDNRPDVIWDYTSPKLPKGSRKQELKITVQELLENLNQCQASECNSKSAPYIKLLENWMSKQIPQTKVKKIDNKKEVKNRSRNRIEELRKFIESIQGPKKELDSKSQLGLQENTEKAGKCDSAESKENFKNSFLDGGSTDDSSEELWGDVDNSFIVKATQELDKVTVMSSTSSNQVEEIVSIVPATIPCAPAIELEQHTCEQYSDLILQLTNVDWELDDDEWENAFLMDDDLSLIPENVLSGECIPQVEEKRNRLETPSVCKNANTSDKFVPISVKTDLAAKNKQPLSMCFKKTDINVVTDDLPDAELFNSFDDDSFEEESLLCQPEVLSRIDEVESMASQPKCTPEEIEKKKDEAMRRRKNLK